MNRTTRRMLGNSNTTEQDFYPSSSDTLRAIDEAIRLNGLRLTSLPAQPRTPHQILVLDDDIARGLSLRSRQLVSESYPSLAGQRTRQVPTHQEQSRFTHNEQNKAFKKLRKEFYIPKPKRIVMRLYYRENPKNYINEQNEGRERCPICLEDFEIEEVLVTPCNHIFHEECIIPWVKSHDQCPVCRFAGLQ
ncbi:E3 ubiquitin-protein ligase RNF126 [Vitis vinifera]|uniref:E3 ubiquitin-protein ligase RNF126 n=1 Tax=Vitis vinifera TaxID=29760 RepID=A0A438DBX3_VITVI|nr:E3 ubiquitin-protein ligase RNF126 [Vitis vinifera]